MIKILVLAPSLALLLNGCGLSRSIHGGAGSVRGFEIVRTARKMIGTPYHYGGSSPREGFDCSGLTWWVFKQNGISLADSAKSQAGHGQAVAREDLEEGDLVFFRTGGKAVAHVGIYSGNKRFIHAPSTGKDVEEAGMDNVYWSPRFVTGRRMF